MLEFKIGYKTFKLQADLKALVREATEYMEYGYADATRVEIESEKPVSEEDFKYDVEALVNYLITLDLKPDLLEQLVVDKMDKKKDGWLSKGRIQVLFRCDKTAYISEEEYGYRCYCLKAKSISADTIDLFVREEVFKW